MPYFLVVEGASVNCGSKYYIFHQYIGKKYTIRMRGGITKSPKIRLRLIKADLLIFLSLFTDFRERVAIIIYFLIILGWGGEEGVKENQPQPDFCNNKNWWHT